MTLQSWQRRFATQLDAAETPADPGMQVYHHHVRAQFRKALAMSFPVIADLLGASVFNAVAERFRQINPSRSGDLHPSGTNFPAFLAAEADTVAGSIKESNRSPFSVDIAELARLEWHWQCALIAADRVAIDVAALSSYRPEQWPSLRLQLQPSFSVLRWHTPVVSYWQTHRERTTSVMSDTNMSDTNMSGPEQAWLAGTPRGPILQSCNAATAEWLLALAAGANLATALEAVESGADIDITIALKSLFNHGAVVSVDLRADDHA